MVALFLSGHGAQSGVSIPFMTRLCFIKTVIFFLIVIMRFHMSHIIWDSLIFCISSYIIIHNYCRWYKSNWTFVIITLNFSPFIYLFLSYFIFDLLRLKYSNSFCNRIIEYYLSFLIPEPSQQFNPNLMWAQIIYISHYIIKLCDDDFTPGSGVCI